MNPTLLYELADADDAIAATKLLQARGVTRLEAYTPHAVPELEALLTKRSRIPVVALIAGTLGGVLAFGILFYCNAYDYPLDVGGRPLSSLPSNVPIAFETTVLFAALATFVAFLVRCRLPRLAHPIFAVEGFEDVSVDRFWIGVDVGDAEIAAVDDAVREVAPRAVRRRPAVS